MDESRRKTLLELIELATDNSPNSCWDDSRARQMLQRQATRDELRELGMDEPMIDLVFSERHG